MLSATTHQEIKFGDNDTLSAIAANMVNADYLFLMTDVNCLYVYRYMKMSDFKRLKWTLSHRYTDNPRKNPDAKPVWVVRDIQRCRQQGKPVYRNTLEEPLILEPDQYPRQL
jgi:glutamate 5-kinase